MFLSILIHFYFKTFKLNINALNYDNVNYWYFKSPILFWELYNVKIWL